MFIALIVLGSALGYLTAGRTVANASWRAWSKGDPKAPTARFFFPYKSRCEPEGFGRRTGNISNDFPGVYAVNPEDPFDLAVYHWCTTGLWPFKLAWCVLASLGIGANHVFQWITSGPSRLLLPSGDRKALPETAAAEPTQEPSPPERRYLDADRRERELQAQMDATRIEKQEAADALGGESEARKLAALPERNL